MIWFIWSVLFNQTNETDQINKKDQLAPLFPWVIAW